ncbi:unnamed protein product [Mytilus coruscus]|uniref:Uncharacterized protein n=1 Tax=Mytilus coruscus TaxID=42192 RepID=A0A6J8CNJ0_MYTCO|nr:unnamed protein product [Mytilus coruscus]
MRYFVRWPWKEENYELPVNREFVMGRLRSCFARMRNKPELMTQYNLVIQDQFTKGMIELVDEKRVDGKKHFIPHHAVITPQKSTTKLKIVYVAPANMNKDVNSLNGCLYHGPVVLRNLCATIESHLNKYNTPTAEQIKNNMYVDNLITGANTVTDALTHYSESKQIFKDAFMNLREWISNSQSLNDFLLPEDEPKVNQTKVLGHLWNIENDTLSVKHSQSFINSGNITKRKTLKEISEVFDPLGLFSPILISGKIFLHDLWKKHLRWDDELQNTYSLKWGSIQTDLQTFSECHISRSIGIRTEEEEGSFYERLVGVVKRSLRKVLKGRLVSDIQLLTVIKETEAIVNARLLVYKGDESSTELLYPLDIEEKTEVDEDNTSQSESNETRPVRKSAEKARHISDDDTVLDLLQDLSDVQDIGEDFNIDEFLSSGESEHLIHDENNNMCENFNFDDCISSTESVGLMETKMPYEDISSPDTFEHSVENKSTDNDVIVISDEEYNPETTVEISHVTTKNTNNRTNIYQDCFVYQRR